MAAQRLAIETEKLDIERAILSGVIILSFFLIMWLKKKFVGKSENKLSLILSFIFNIVILIAFVFSMLLALGVTFDNVWENIKNYLIDNTSKLAISMVVIIISITIYSTVRLVISKSGKRRNDKRYKTVSKVIMSLSRYVIYIVAGIVLLGIWGVNVMPALAGLGIAGLVIGLGAQKLIGDFVNGVFIIFEHHFDVGDIISVGEFKGEVIDIGLKTTKILNWEGNIKIIANGDITDLVNYSLKETVFNVEFDVAYKENIQHVTELLNQELPKRLAGNPNILAAPYVAGVTNLGNSGVRLRITTTTVAETQYAISRKIYQLIKEIFEENQIEIPFSQVVFHQGDKND